MASTQRQRRCSLEQQLYNGLKVEVGKNSKCHCKLAKKGQEHRDSQDRSASVTQGTVTKRELAPTRNLNVKGV